MALDHIGEYIYGAMSHDPRERFQDREVDLEGVKQEIPDIERLRDELYTGALDPESLVHRNAKLLVLEHNTRLVGPALFYVQKARETVSRVLDQKRG